MAFDAGMMAAVAAELQQTIIGSKIEKIYQPGKDEITLCLRGVTRRLMVNVSGDRPRVCLTKLVRENPQVAPMFCMLLRKHLSGAVLREVHQEGFERVLRFKFETRDEMGYPCTRYLICEIMGKWSNLMFCNEADKILAVLRPVDFTTSQKRQVLPGMTYTLPPAQDHKTNPLQETQNSFLQRLRAAQDMPTDRFLLSAYSGFSPLTAREISFQACLDVSRPANACDPILLYQSFSRVVQYITSQYFTPVLLRDETGNVTEYSWFEIAQYGLHASCEHCTDFGSLLDAFYEEKDRTSRLHQRAGDIFKLLSAAQSRLSRKYNILKKELADTENMETYKRYGDLITGNIYCLSRGMANADLTDWSDPDQRQVRVKLDVRLTPAQNAQRYYKKYNKAKTAQTMLQTQIKHTEEELTYLDTVFDALSRAQSSTDLDEIREELERTGYATRKTQTKKTATRKQYHPMEFVTDEGYTVLCGKNNLQNEYITHTRADRHDWWFHVKNAPGAHVILVTNGQEPDALSFTQAATIAATYSGRGEGEAKHITVDYTQVHNLKKVPGAKPGMVIYHTNYAAYVTPDPGLCERLRVK